MKSLRDTELRILLMLVRISSARTNPAAPVKLTYKRLTEQTGRHKEAVVSAIRNLTRLGLIHSSLASTDEDLESVRFPRRISEQGQKQKEQM
jgi:hypothetical protein